MAYFGKAPEKKGHDYRQRDEAKNHADRSSKSVWPSQSKLGLRKIADHRSGILPNSGLVPNTERHVLNFDSFPEQAIRQCCSQLIRPLARLRARRIR